MNLTLQPYHKSPVYKFLVQFDRVLSTVDYFERLNWCSYNLKDRWDHDTDDLTTPNSDRFWFADEQEALLFLLRWS